MRVRWQLAQARSYTTWPASCTSSVNERMASCALVAAGEVIRTADAKVAAQMGNLEEFFIRMLPVSRRIGLG
jgi:hypothetical protein